jgi:hypothetical protein
VVPAAGGQGPALLVWEDDLIRLGVDASVWVDRLNLYGVYMYGRNDNSIADRANPSGTGESLSFNGGFLQADFHLRDWVALTGRLNVDQALLRVRLPQRGPPQLRRGAGGDSPVGRARPCQAARLCPLV